MLQYELEIFFHVKIERFMSKSSLKAATHVKQIGNCQFFLVIAIFKLGSTVEPLLVV